MTPPSRSWLLPLAVLCLLTTLLEGQHLGVKKCVSDCGKDKMTSLIPLSRLIGYRWNEESCSKRAIILETKKHLHLCADPSEEWVKKAMQHLDHKASVLTPNGGTFAKQIGLAKPRTAPVTQAVDGPGLSEPKATEKNSEQETQKALGTRTELPVGVPSSWRTGPTSASEALDGGSSAGSTGAKLVSMAAGTTTSSWQSSAASQFGSGFGSDGKGSEAPTTQTPSTQAPSTPAPATQASSSQTLSTQTPSTPAPATPAPSTQVPVMSAFAFTVPEDSVGPTAGQGYRPEASLEPKELTPLSHTDTSLGPQTSEVSQEGDPSREPVASGSWPPKTEETIHATGDPQRLGVLITAVPDSQVATRRQAVGLLAFLGLLFCVGVAMFAYQSLQGCPRKVAGDMVEGLRYVPRSCGSNSYVLVPV